MNQHMGWAPALLALAITGCAAPPGVRHEADIQALVAERQAPASVPASTGAASTPAAAPTPSIESALRDALATSPAARAIWARYGITEAEVRESLRLQNPSLGFLRLSADGGIRETTYSLSQPLLDLLFTGYRRRQGELAAQQAMQRCAAELLGLEADIRIAFIGHAAAVLAQRAGQREREAAELSAQLAARFHAAGNISELQLRREQAAASEAALLALQRDVDVAQARGHLLSLLGHSGSDSSALPEIAVPLLDAEPASLAELQQRAAVQRLDLAALRAERDLRATQARHTRRWSWFRGATLEAERETATGESARTGGGVALELPLFDSGANRRRGAAARLQLREAQLQGLTTHITNEVEARRAEVQARREAVSMHASTLIEQRERIVLLTQQRADFMLVGSFELIAARQQQFAAWRTWIESVAQLARAQIRLAQAMGRAAPDITITEMLDLEDLP